jgi:hypothetical protein
MLFWFWTVPSRKEDSLLITTLTQFHKLQLWHRVKQRQNNTLLMLRQVVQVSSGTWPSLGLFSFSPGWSHYLHSYWNNHFSLCPRTLLPSLHRNRATDKKEGRDQKIAAISQCGSWLGCSSYCLETPYQLSQPNTASPPTNTLCASLPINQKLFLGNLFFLQNAMHIAHFYSCLNLSKSMPELGHRGLDAGVERCKEAEILPWRRRWVNRSSTGRNQGPLGHHSPVLGMLATTFGVLWIPPPNCWELAIVWCYYTASHWIVCSLQILMLTPVPQNVYREGGPLKGWIN